MEEDIIKLLIGFINMLVLGFAGILWYNFKKMDTRITEVEEDMKQMKDNYLTLFEKVNEGISQIKVAIARIETSLNDFIKNHKK